MKLKNILISFAIIVFSLLSVEVKAASTAPSSYNVNASDLKSLYGSNYLGHGSTLNFSYKKNANGNVIYCTEIHDSMVKSGSEKYTLSGEMDAKFAYILANGYPNKSISGDANEDYYITGLAIWYLISPNDSTFTYFDLSKGTYKGYDSFVVKEIAKLVNGANKYTYTNPTIKINSSSNGLTLSSDKKYYVSSSIGVTTTGTVGNYTVSLKNAPSGTIVTDKNGTAKTNFGVGETFLVKVPASSINSLSGEFSVDVSAVGTINKAYKYIPTDSAHQSTTVLYPENKNVSDSTVLKYSFTTEVQVSKVDATNNKELPGAKLTVKDANGKVVDSWTSTSEVHVIKGLAAGKYTLIEEKQPEGYVLSTEKITFEVKLDGTVTKVTMKNEPTKVEISKVDATTEKELPGAKLTVKDANGKVVDSWTSTNEVHVIKGLAAGKYTLIEEKQPEGYVLSTEKITFEVKADGTVTKVVMKNELEEAKPVYISKQDATTGKELPGAHLELRDENGKLVDEWVSEEQPHRIEELKPGKYYLTETLQPEGYELSTETVEFTVKEDGTVDGKIIMYNTPSKVEVPVEPTSSFKTITSSLIGIVVIGLGSMLIYRNYKKREEY